MRGWSLQSTTRIKYKYILFHKLSGLSLFLFSALSLGSTISNTSLTEANSQKVLEEQENQWNKAFKQSRTTHSSKQATKPTLCLLWRFIGMRNAQAQSHTGQFPITILLCSVYSFPVLPTLYLRVCVCMRCKRITSQNRSSTRWPRRSKTMLYGHALLAVSSQYPSALHSPVGRVFCNPLPTG